MRVLIVGASGFVGSALRAVFGSDTVGTYWNHAEDSLRQLDIRDAAAVNRLVRELRPELVIHPAAQPNVDWCDDHTQESYDVNVRGTRNVAEACRAAGARYVFFSTDYIFDGSHGPYREDATPGALNVYGQHKLESERLIAGLLDDYAIVRVCWVYGIEKQGKNFIMGLLDKGRRGVAMQVPSDQWGNPTYGENLAAAVRELALSSRRGVYHVVGPEHVSRFAFAKLACDVFGIDPSFLRPRCTSELGQRASRPLRGGLDTGKARAVLATPLLNPRDGLESMKERLRSEGFIR